MRTGVAPDAKVLFLIRTAMAVGVVTFMLVAWFLRNRGGMDPVPADKLATLTTVMYTAVALAAGAVMLIRLRLSGATPDARRSLSIAGWAVGEFAALFGGVLFLLDGRWSLVLPGALVFALSLAAIPLPRD
ncbi:MAG: hypothetical protein ACYC3L_07215 [Gemmatimonadaceae bacterium]